MRIGFIGAGKMGHTLGKHITEAEDFLQDLDIKVVGYYSRNPQSAKEAAQFTDTLYYESIERLVDDCDTLFITTPDGQIAKVADEISGMLKQVKRDIILIHTSGALTSQVFSGIGNHIYGYSVHPIYAVNSKTESYVNFSSAYITIEGNEKYISRIEALFSLLGHPVKLIGAECKTKYHAAAVFASNLVVSLFSKSTSLLTECGFSKKEACEALTPLFMNNAFNLSKKGIEGALTGPVSRGDTETVIKHLSVLCGDEKEIYRLLSLELLNIVSAGDEKYDSMRDILK